MKSKIIILLIFVALLAATVVPVVFKTLSQQAEASAPDTDEAPSTEEDEGGINLSVQGPKVYLSIKVLKDKFGQLLGNPITQTTLTISAVSVILITLAFIINRSILKRPGRFQVVVEKLVNMLYGLVEDTMGKHNARFAPLVGTIFLS